MRYKIFGQTGLRISEVCLGTMTFGTDWGWGADAKTSARILDIFADRGGNFIDTANSYTNGSSESILGDLLTTRRDRFVVGTKFSQLTDSNNINSSGNNRKSLRLSVEQSLRRLKTEYIDILWLHAWDQTTPIDEILSAMDDVVKSGKVLYIGASDSPAWLLSGGLAMSEIKKWSSFAGIQVEYNLLERTAERELIPMANYFGLTVTAWGPLSAGLLTGKYHKDVSGRIEVARDFYGGLLNERNKLMVDKLLKVAHQANIPLNELALRWLRSKNVIPILGATSERQLEENLKSIQQASVQEAIVEADTITRTSLGFPHEFLNSAAVRYLLFNGLDQSIDSARGNV